MPMSSTPPVSIEADETRPTPRGRGFAGMDPARQRAIAREGGRAAHEQGKAHEFTPAEARMAGLESRRRQLERQAAARPPDEDLPA